MEMESDSQLRQRRVVARQYSSHEFKENENLDLGTPLSEAAFPFHSPQAQFNEISTPVYPDQDEIVISQQGRPPRYQFYLEKTKAVRYFGYAARIIFPVCLLCGFLLQINIIGALYLLFFITGVTFTFQNRFLTGLTTATALASLIGQVVMQIVYAANASTWIPPTIIETLGLIRFDGTLEYVVFLGKDVLVMVGGVVQLLYLAQRSKFTESYERLPGTSFEMMQAIETSMVEMSVGSCDAMVCALIFISALAVPAILSGIYYAVLFLALIKWTFFSSKVTLESLHLKHAAKSECIFGKLTCQLLYFYNAIVITLFYVYQFEDIHSNDSISSLGTDLGFFISPGSLSDWPAYVYAAAQIALLVTLAAAIRAHRSDRIPSLQELDDIGPEDEEQDYREMLRTYLKGEPFLVRLLFKQRGILFASFVSIIWCTSYPSYLTAILFLIAIVSIAVYGCRVPAIFLPIMTIYSISLVAVEYAFNLPFRLVDSGPNKWGLYHLDFPFPELMFKNACVIFICWCCRTRLRYYGVLKGLAHDDSDDEAEFDEAESDQAEEPNSRGIKLRPARGKLLKAWGRDAKEVFMEYLDELVLITIFIVVLSTTVNLLQTGYLILATMFAKNDLYRRRYWRWLLLYALLVAFAQFFWNVLCPTSTLTSDLIGLRCFNDNVTWSSLWPTLFSAQLLVIGQSVIQLAIYTSDTGDRDIKAGAIQRPWFFLSRILVEADRLFTMHGVILCYAMFLVVPLNFERFNETNTTVFGAVQLGLLFLVMSIHLLELKTDPRGCTHTRRVWGVIIFVEVFILVSRYVYQFQDIQELLDDAWPFRVVTMQDIGFESYSREDGLSTLFFRLLPTAILAILASLQFAALSKSVVPYGLLVAGRSVKIDRLIFIADTIKRTLYMHSPKVTVLITAIVALNWISFIGGVYLVVLLTSVPRRSWHNLWVILFLYSFAVLLSKYIYQLSAFEAGKYAFSDGPGAEWIGLTRLTIEHSSLWFLLKGQLYIIMVCIFQRGSQLFQDSVTDNGLNMTALSTLRHRSSSMSMDAGTSDGSERRSILSVGGMSNTSIASDDDGDGPEVVVMTPPAEKNVQFTNKDESFHQMAPKEWTQTLMMTEHQLQFEENDFFTNLRDFVLSYGKEAALDLLMLLFVIASFIHLDIIGLVEILMVGYMLRAPRERSRKLYWLWALFLTCLIAGQYTIILWLPPQLKIEQQSTWPWSGLSNAYQYWLALDHQNQWALFVDFMALVCAYMIPRAANTTTKAKEENRSPNAESSDRFPGDADDFTWPSRRSLWSITQFVIISYWVLLLLVLVFVTGCLQSGIAAGIYLLLSIYMLYFLDKVEEPGSKLLTYLRVFNWSYLAILLLFQAPFFSDRGQTCEIGTNTSSELCLSVAIVFGLFKYDVSYPGAESYNRGPPVSSIIIFIMISIQSQIFLTDGYFYVREYKKRELLMKDERRKMLNEHFIKKRTRQWMKMKREKAAAIVRLKLIVSKLVNKVEELMDIATGLHYSLPPMAPGTPEVRSASQNGITVSWTPPENSVHRIRKYRIIRQTYPSLTLLGDFSDLVEVNGDQTETTIEGLRPGTSYQFKVAAVSRMGEGPFSSPSIPQSTETLDLKGSSAAGWIRYSKKLLPVPRFQLPWMGRKFLTRYAVLDKRQFTIYKNEQIALRHRSLKKRKRMKTSFQLRRVVLINLTESVQHDDTCPSLPCLEITATQRDRTTEAVHKFQPEFGKDFAKWIQTIAFLVPRRSIDQNVIDYLVKHKLECPLEEVSTFEAAVDDGRSEWSSITGDESWMGDVEAAEEDNPKKKIWWLPLYQWVYSFQDIVYRDITEAYDDFEECGPSWDEIFRVVTNAIRSHTASICYFAFIASFAFQGDLLNIIYVITLFWYLLFENPRPKPKLWRAALRYSFFVIFCRYLFQLPVFCQNITSDFYLYPSFQPFCPSDTDYRSNQVPVQPMALLGLYKFDGTVNPNIDSMFDGLKWNFLVVLAILVHRKELQLRGIWLKSKFEEDNVVRLTDLRNNGSTSSFLSQDSVEKVSANDLAEALAAHRRKQLNVEEKPPTSDQLEAELAKEALEIEEKDDKAKEEDAKERKKEDDEDPEDQEDENLPVAQPVYIDEGSHHINQQKSLSTWMAAQLPRPVKKYYDRVLVEPPPGWDKDIVKAVEGRKPGRDYYTSSLLVLLVSIIYLILFYSSMGEPEATEGFSVNLSDSMLSGYMVLCVFIELCIMIWDRAAYIYGSLLSKLILQYSYVFLVHLGVWILIPLYTNIYFQNRTALVIFYLLQCVYMWLGARQIRFGYKVLRGSKFKPDEKSFYASFVKEAYEVYMFVPFAFEMRALLDYVCTTTSLKLQMWLLLEETAANLFIVTAEMESRIEEKKTLHGNRRQPILKKLLTGGVILVILLICLVGPLALFSTANPSTQRNEIKVAQMTFSVLESRSQLVHTLFENKNSGSSAFDLKVYATETFTQRILFSASSQSIWTSSPPQRQQLAQQLSSDADLEWSLELVLTRDGPEGHQVVNYNINAPLKGDHRQQLSAAVNSTDSVTDPIVIDAFYIPVLKVSATKGADARRSFSSRRVELRKYTDPTSSWWELSSIDSKAYDDIGEFDPDDHVECLIGGLCFVTVSENIVTGLSDLGIGAYGITAVYIFVLFTIGSFVKEAMRGALYEIIYTELPDPSDLLELCEGIYIAREENYIGHLKDEVRLYETLIRVLRSPETLLRVTGPNVIHIPEKEKLD